ncbi:unnamed protein product [Brassica oleracea var. botrytis]|uniref:(rape) hypothetical protein n=1 Tax=Brassica napus TaxID=3708 RepID=A0A816MKY9_BRANA|nr:unnamed protein product [Brassica napus]
MMIQNVPDTSSLDYWLNWRVFLCAVWVLTPMIIALFVIWKFEKDSSVETQRPKGSYSEHSEDIWRPSLKQIHPGWLLGFRVLAFCFLLTSNIVRLAFRGFRIYYYYTQWTFTLITIYFRMGSLFSVYGCFQHKKQTCFSLRRYIRPSDSKTLASCVKLFHIIFQTSAGAAVLTDSIYWTVIFPFLSLQDYEMSFVLLLHLVDRKFCYFPMASPCVYLRRVAISISRPFNSHGSSVVSVGSTPASSFLCPLCIIRQNQTPIHILK